MNYARYYTTLPVFFLTLLLSLYSVCDTAESSSQKVLQFEITHLIEIVKSSGCVFEKNGSRHTAKEVAAHLKRKLHDNEANLKTTEEFIEKVASKSTWTGKPYFVSCTRDRQVRRSPVNYWLNQKLIDYRNMERPKEMWQWGSKSWTLWCRAMMATQSNSNFGGTNLVKC